MSSITNPERKTVGFIKRVLLEFTGFPSYTVLRHIISYACYNRTKNNSLIAYKFRNMPFGSAKGFR